MRNISSLWRISLFFFAICLFGAIFTLYSIYNNTALSRMIPTGVRFDSKLSRIYAMKKVSGITIRKTNGKWTSADDICYTGVVYPSYKVTSTLVNTTVYFHSEKELQTTKTELRGKGSWARQNLHLLLGRMSILTNATFIDIYAGLGIHSLSVARLGRQVIAVEYRYTFAERLCRGIIAGNIREKVIIVNNMVSHVSLTANLQPEHAGQRSFIESNMTDDVLTEVASIQLTALVEKLNMKEVVLRIDMDNDVIQTVISSSKFFDEVKIHFILMKWSNTATSKEANSLIDFMKDYALIPCINPKCRSLLKKENFSSWPAYVWWVNRVHLPQPIKSIHS